MKNKEEFRRLIEEANEAKDRLARIAEGLEEEGYERKAKSCMNLVWAIERWQNRSA